MRGQPQPIRGDLRRLRPAASHASAWFGTHDTHEIGFLASGVFGLNFDQLVRFRAAFGSALHNARRWSVVVPCSRRALAHGSHRSRAKGHFAASVASSLPVEHHASSRRSST